jgi:hypothetical protein
MSQHSKVGDISLPVGEYTGNDGKPKKRFRNIGTLMKTADPGGDRFWIKLNADILHASLYALSSIAREKGEDTVIATVFEPRP